MYDLSVTHTQPVLAHQPRPRPAQQHTLCLGAPRAACRGRKGGRLSVSGPDHFVASFIRALVGALRLFTVPGIEFWKGLRRSVMTKAVPGLQVAFAEHVHLKLLTGKADEAWT